MIDEKKLIEDLKKNNFDILMTDAECFGLEKCTENVIELINEQQKVGEWIPVTYHKTTEEDGVDKERYPFFLDCRIPDYGQEIIICMKDGSVYTDTSFDDDGCYLESGIDWIDVIAWQPLPEPYRPNDQEEKKHATNADRIRSMSDEELTDIILCPYDTAGKPAHIMPCVKDGNIQELVSPEYCKKCMMKWLQSEVEEQIG